MINLKEYIINEMASDMPYTEKELKDLFNKFNKEYFNDKLDNNIPIHYNNRKHSIGLFRYNIELNKIFPISIEITSKYNLSKLDIESVLIHEMIHYFICMFLPDEFRSISHGPTFISMMKKINTKNQHKISIEYEDQLNLNHKEKKFILLLELKDNKYGFIKINLNKTTIENVVTLLLYIYKEESIKHKNNPYYKININSIKCILSDDEFFEKYSASRVYKGYYIFKNSENELYFKLNEEGTLIESMEDLKIYLKENKIG